MKTNKVLSILPIFLLGTTLFYFSSCPTVNINTGSGGSSGSTVQFTQPSWAINQAGNVQITIQSPSMLFYNPNLGLSYTLPMSYTNSIYTESNNQLTVTYQIATYGNISPSSGSFTPQTPIYNPSSKSITVITYPLQALQLKLPSGLQAVPSSLLIEIQYNISNVQTNIEIPLILKNTNSGITLTEPIYYSSSPVIPTSNSIQITEGGGYATFSLSLEDALGCFSAMNPSLGEIPEINIDNTVLQLNAGGQLINVQNGQNGFDCAPTGTIPLQSAAIVCQINMNQLASSYPSIQSALSSNVGVIGGVLINITYNCEEQTSFSIPLNET
ncbi:MAG: hypothetical protein ACP5GJ_03695 [Nanopusillaceae archaeon]|jgi:hypothetical protein